MKKITVFLTTILLLCFSFLFTACGSEKLSTPANLYVDDSDVLNWSEVTSARTYTVEIAKEGGETTEKSTRSAIYRLAGLEEGDYNIRVKAVGGDGSVVSPWSEVIYFKKFKDYGYTFRSLDDGLAWALTSARSSVGDVVIEDRYRNKPVIEISDGAFRNNQEVTTVKLGKFVRKIGERVFYNCSALTKVEIPDSVTTIGSSLFHGCSLLTDAALPEGFTSIPDYTFAYCSALTSFEIPQTVTSIGESAFYACNSLGSLDIPESVQSIGQYAFSRDAALTSVKLGGGLTDVGPYAFLNDENLSSVEFAEEYDSLTLGTGIFSGCTALTGATLPEGLQGLPNRMFEGCSNFGSVNIPESVTSVGQLCFNNTKLINETGTTYIDNWLVYAAVDYLLNLQTLIPSSFQSGVIGIADAVFYGCPKLSNIQFPRALLYVGKYAFQSCTALYKVETEAGSQLKLLDQSCFNGCTNLSSLLIADSCVETIGSGAFRNCTLLHNNGNNPTEVVPETVKHIGSNAFANSGIYNDEHVDTIYAGNWVVGYDSSASSTITLREGTAGIADYAFANNATLTRVVGIENVTNIGAGAFSMCMALQVAALSNRITTIEPYTFFQCVALAGIGGDKFPSRINSIGEYAFFQCDSLTSIDLSDTQLTEIKPYAFYSCGAALRIVLNNKIEKIGDYAFYHNLVTQIEIPESVKSIGSHAFMLSERLQTLTFSEGLEDIADYAFRACVSLKQINLPDSLKKIGKAAFMQCSVVESIDCGDGLEEIGDYAFASLVNVKSVKLSSSLTDIGDYAFLYCMSLNPVVLTDGIEYVGNYAFYGCDTATIFSSSDAMPENWGGRWNASFRPVFYGTTFAPEGYVVSVKVTDPAALTARGGIVLSREGYVLAGWSSSADSTEIEYKVNGLNEAPAGATLYAVWQPAV